MKANSEKYRWNPHQKSQGSYKRLVLQAILGERRACREIQNLGIYEVCDSKIEKPALTFCFKMTPLRYSAFAWLVGLTILAQ